MGASAIAKVNARRRRFDARLPYFRPPPNVPATAMIQRLQSIFLLLSGGCLGGSLAVPFADASQPVANTLFADAVYTAGDSLGLLVLFGLGMLAAVAAIFLYGNRLLQRNVAWAAAICTLGAIAFGVFYFMQQAPLMGDVAVDEEWGVALPLLAIVFAVLAVRYINKDERLVRSADRLR